MALVSAGALASAPTASAVGRTTSSTLRRRASSRTCCIVLAAALDLTRLPGPLAGVLSRV